MQWDAIRNRARSDLVVTTEQGEPDLFLWEHTERVAASARWIASLPGVRAQAPDELAVIAAAWYHDAGWAVRVAEKEIHRGDVLVRPPSERHYEQGATLLERGLRELMPAESLNRAAHAIRSLNHKPIESIEGRIISEADALDEFGLLSLWRVIRRGAADGKGIQAVLDMWRAKREFRFWEARLNSAFQFQPVRNVAESRLERVERFMQDLELEQKGADLPPRSNPTG